MDSLSRYTKITLPDGTVKRVSKKIIQKTSAPSLKNLLNTISDPDELYSLIDSSMNNEWMLSIPALILRNVADDLSNWEDPAVQDRRLLEIFKKHVNAAVNNEHEEASHLNISSISDRLRYVLAGFLTDPTNPVTPKDLESMSVTEMYTMANELIDTHEAQKVKDFFFTEFMNNFYFVTVPLVARAGARDPPVPGVNCGTDLNAILYIIHIFTEYVDLDDN